MFLFKEEQERIKEEKKDIVKTTQSKEDYIKQQDLNKIKFYEYKEIIKLIKIIIFY